MAIFDKIKNLVEKDDYQAEIEDIRTNDALIKRFPTLSGKIYSNKKGHRFVMVNDIIDDCIDKTFLKKTINNLLVFMQDRHESVLDAFENFYNEVDLESAGKVDKEKSILVNEDESNK